MEFILFTLLVINLFTFAYSYINIEELKKKTGRLTTEINRPVNYNNIINRPDVITHEQLKKVMEYLKQKNNKY